MRPTCNESYGMETPLERCHFLNKEMCPACIVCHGAETLSESSHFLYKEVYLTHQLS